MADAKEMDETGDRVVWHNAFKEVVLVRPAHRELVACQLHPYTIYRIFGNDKCLCHDQMVAQIDVQLLAKRIDRQIV